MYFSKLMRLTNFKINFYQVLKEYFSKPLEAARKFYVNAIDCSSVLRVTCPCFVCVCVFVIPFFALFLCFYLILFLAS